MFLNAHFLQSVKPVAFIYREKSARFTTCQELEFGGKGVQTVQQIGGANHRGAGRANPTHENKINYRSSFVTNPFMLNHDTLNPFSSLFLSFFFLPYLQFN